MRKKILVPVVFVGVAGAFHWHVCPPARLFAIKAAGRSPVCPMDHALKAEENERLQIRYKDEILHGSKLLEKDPAGYHLWDTPRGRWWVPQGDDFVLPFNLAEQQRQIYGTGEQTVKQGDIVLDCFSGSGSTIIAAAKTGRRGRAIELDPHYVDVGVKRWEKWLAEVARHAATGLTVDQLKETRLAGTQSSAHSADGDPGPAPVRHRARPTKPVEAAHE